MNENRLVSCRLIFACLGLVWLLTGCSVGPRMLRQGHLEYNISVKAASDEELLLNIIRLRYLDTIEFLATNSISAQTSVSVSLGGRFGTDRGATTNLVIPDLTFSDRPTFTFTPQRGREFAQRLTKPVDIDTFAYLAASDWPINHLLILLGSEINGIVNEPGFSVVEFNRVARSLLDMQKKGDLLVGFMERQEYLSDPIDAHRITGSDMLKAANSGYRFRNLPDRDQVRLTRTIPQPVMWIRHDRLGVVSQVRKALRLAEDSQPPYDIRTGAGLYRREIDYRSIVIRTRSILGAIVYLSQAVHPPESHLESKIATREWPLPGGINDLSSFFNIQSSRERPMASLAVKYRDFWFYIDETDMASKSTFLVLSEFYRLAISDSRPGQVPVLTLPVGGP